MCSLHEQIVYNTTLVERAPKNRHFALNRNTHDILTVFIYKDYYLIHYLRYLILGCGIVMWTIVQIILSGSVKGIIGFATTFIRNLKHLKSCHMFSFL